MTVLVSQNSKIGSTASEDAKQPKMKWIIQSFLDISEYTPPHEVMEAITDTAALEEAVGLVVASWKADDGENGERFASVLKKAVSLVQFFYPHHSFEAKLGASLYTWFFFYIDDCASPSALAAFHQHILLGSPQKDVPLRHFSEVLGGLYQHWDPICAGSMVAAALEFVSGNVLESRKDINEMRFRPTASSWPKYLRAKTGMAPGFSNALFPRQAHPDLSAFIQIIPDIDDWMCLVNDILSHYKEDIAGETMGYIPVRAETMQKHPTQVLVEMVQEAGELRMRIVETLKGEPEALAAWMTCERGFIAFHISNKRYKLADLGFSPVMQI
ncbi:isoprenoid synthase domain-containing protein [Mycena rebaudengoi]|nr:isoprenoid synthase domain-containing protein [Mycena rebaudengoi]